MIYDSFFFLMLSMKYADFILKSLSIYLEKKVHFNFAPAIISHKIILFFIYIQESNLNCNFLLSNSSHRGTALFSK